MALTKIDDRGITYPLDLIDNEKIRLGTGNDLEIYHDGSHSYIKDTGTGELRLASSQFTVQNAASNETLLYAVENGSVGLKYDDSLKLETKSYGLSLHGNVLMTNTDNQQLKFGAGNDLVIYHDGTDSYIDNSTNELIVKTGSNFVVKVTDGAEKTIKGITNGAVELYYDNSKQFETAPSGLLGADNHRLMLGSDSDLQLWHNGTNSYITETSSGSLWIGGDSVIISRQDNSEYMAKFIVNGAADLYYDGTKKLNTHTDGVEILGKLYMADNKNIELGNSQDFKIYHAGGTANKIESGANTLYLAANDLQITNAAISEACLKTFADGAVELYYDNTLRLATNSNGIEVNGHVWLGDGEHVKFGSSTNGDLQIYHSGNWLSLIHI